MKKSLYISPFSRSMSLRDAAPLMWGLMDSLGMAEGGAPARRAASNNEIPLTK